MTVRWKIYPIAFFILIFFSACNAINILDPAYIATETSPSLDDEYRKVLPTERPLETDEFQGDDIASAATLGSLEKIEDYPLYSMTYHGSYRTGWLDDSRLTTFVETSASLQVNLPPAFACSLFVTLSDPQSLLYGRNFDWEYSPALFLYTDPPDGYASVSMVNIAFIHRWGEEVKVLDELPLDEIDNLLRSPFLPIDGMNEQGLVVGMAAVPSSPKPFDSSRDTISSLAIIREMLDHAQDIEGAVAILESYNVDWSGGPPIHYLMADRSGEAVLVEFFENEMVVIPAGGKWHQATNFLVSTDPEDPGDRCWRYDTINQQMDQAAGELSVEQALGLLKDVSQGGTQWSVVYDLSRGEVYIVMGRSYDRVNEFQLK